jgi:hypothetical protein
MERRALLRLWLRAERGRSITSLDLPAYRHETASEATPRTVEAPPRWVALFDNAPLTRGRS